MRLPPPGRRPGGVPLAFRHSMRRIQARERGPRTGLTLLELAMSIAVMVVGVSALASTVVTGSALNQVSHETEVARKAIETQIDAMRSTAFSQVFATYN